jgi:hypothetical protein
VASFLVEDDVGSEGDDVIIRESDASLMVANSPESDASVVLLNDLDASVVVVNCPGSDASVIVMVGADDVSIAEDITVAFIEAQNEYPSSLSSLARFIDCGVSH